MKRVYLVFFIAMLSILVLPVAGASEDDEEIIVVSILAETEAVKDILNQLSKQYIEEMELYGVEFDISFVKDRENYISDIETALLEGRAPTLFLLGTSDISRLHENLAPMDYSMASMYANYSALFPVTKDGAVYGLPNGIGCTGIVYNKSILEAADIDPLLIMAYGDLEETAIELEYLKQDLGIEAVFATDTHTLGAVLANVFTSAEFEQDYQTAKESSIFDFVHKSRFEQYTRLFFDYSIFGDSETSAVTLFSEGKAAMVVASANDYGAMLELNPEIAEELGVLPFDIEYDDVVLVEPDIYWAMSKTATEEEEFEAMDFLDWVFCDDSNAAQFYTALGTIPAYTGLDVSEYLNPLQSAFYEYADFDESIITAEDATPEGFIEYVSSDFEELSKSAITFEQFFDNVKNAWDWN